MSSSPASRSQPTLLLLVSGLAVGSGITPAEAAAAAAGGAGSDAAAALLRATHPFALSLLTDYVAGLVGGRNEATGVARIARVIIAGGSIGVSVASASRSATAVAAGDAGGAARASAAAATAAARDPFSDRALAAGEQEAAASSVRELDALLAALASAAPGSSSHQWKLHACLYSACSRRHARIRSAPPSVQLMLWRARAIRPM